MGKLVEYTTVVVRLHDNQRLWIPPKSYYGDIDNTYLPQERLQKFAFFEQREKVGDLAKKFIPSAFTKQTFRDAIDAAVKMVRFSLITPLEIQAIMISHISVILPNQRFIY